MMNTFIKTKSYYTLNTIILCLGLAFPFVLAQAQSSTPINPTNITQQTYHVDIPAGDLAKALNQFAATLGVTLQFDAALTKNLKTSGVSGSFSAQQGFSALLSGTNLSAIAKGDGVYVLQENHGVMTLPAVEITSNSIKESAYGPVEGYVAKRSATATKTDTPLIETPQSISIVTANHAKATGATSLKEALSYTVGINTSPWGNDSQYDWVYLRGFDAYSPGFYFDGLPLRNSGSWSVWQTENYGIERFEYLRGPSSVLYGQNSAGGLVNVVSKRPTVTPLHEIQIQLGNNNRKQIAVDVSDAIDEEEVLFYRVTALAKDAELSVGNNLPNDRLYIAPSLTWNLSDSTQLIFFSQYMDMKVASNWSDFPAEGTLIPNPNGKISASTFNGEASFNNYDQEQLMLGYQFKHQFDQTWTFRQNARYGTYDTEYKTFYSPNFVTVNTNNLSDAVNYRLVSRTPFASYESAKQYTIDNQLQGNISIGDWNHTLLFGLDYQQSEFDVRAYWGGDVDPIDIYKPIYGSEVTVATAAFMDGKTILNQIGFYVQDQIKFDDRWVASFGGRFDSSIVENDSNKQTDDSFTGRAGLVYLADNGLAPYVSFSESFSPNTTINPETGIAFKPETGRQYELGLRYQPINNRDSYSLSVFDIVRKNYVTYDSSFLPKNSGEITVRGIELEALLSPMENWNVTSAYSWTPEADVTSSANLTEIGKRSFNYAEHQFSLWSDYTFPWGIKVGGGVRFTGETYGANEAAPAKIPHYALFDLLVEYQIGSWGFAFNARNLTNKNYVANCNGSGTTCSYGETRNIILTLGYQW